MRIISTILSTILITVLIVTIIFFVFLMIFTNKCENIDNYKSHNKQMFELEKHNSYIPFGDDYFKVSHDNEKNNYFKFFEQLGTVNLTVATRGNKNIGNLISVDRIINSQKVTYFCDFKILEKHRNKNIGKKIILKHLFKENIFNWLTKKWYSINMDKYENNKVKKSNVVHILKKYIPINIKYTRLHIYCLNYPDMIKAYDLFKNISFVEQKNKSLILKSNGEKIKILHMINNFDPPQNLPTVDYLHMFCLLDDDKLIDKLKKIGITTNVTATLMYYGVNPHKLKINTSEL